MVITDPPTKFTGIRLIHGTDNSHMIDKVQIGERFWPITATNALSLLFFKVRNVAHENKQDYFFESPDAYFHMNNFPPNPRDFVQSDGTQNTEEFDLAMETYAHDCQEFKDIHKHWYVKKSQFIHNPQSFIEGIRHERRGSSKGYYRSSGWPMRCTDGRNMWVVS